MSGGQAAGGNQGGIVQHAPAAHSQQNRRSERNQDHPAYVNAPEEPPRQQLQAGYEMMPGAACVPRRWVRGRSRG